MEAQDSDFFLCLRFLISNHKITPITTRNRTAAAAHTEPTVMATVPEVWCEESGIAVELAKESGRVELGWRTETMHCDSETNFPESSNSVQAVGIGDTYL